MRAEDIRKHARRRPFVPLRIYVSDGSQYDVRHPEFIFVMQREVVIGTLPYSEDFPETGVYIDPIHITRIEPINGKKKHPKSRKSR